MSPRTAMILAAVGLAAGVGVWWWLGRSASAATRPAGPSPVRVPGPGGVRTTLLPGAPGYATARQQADALELAANTGAGHF